MRLFCPALLRLSASIAVLASSTCYAEIVVSPDEICAPDADPCVLDRPVEVHAAVPLDFGLRTVRVTGAGRFTGSLDLSCGGFETESDGRWIDVVAAELPEVAIVARRLCSNDSQKACLADGDCSDDGTAACSVGDGGIRLAGDLYGIAPTVKLRASGDVRIDGLLQAAGATGVPYGGDITISSLRGGIEINNTINLRPGRDEQYFKLGMAGNLSLRAHENIRLHGRVRAVGGNSILEFHAGDDILIDNAILTHGVDSWAYGGGGLTMHAGGSITIATAVGSDRTLINMRGGRYTHGFSVDGGPGGEGHMQAGGDIVVGDGVRINADSGRDIGDTDALPFGGDWTLTAGGRIQMNGTLSARGRGESGVSGRTTLNAGQEIAIGATGSIITEGSYVREMEIDSGRVTIAGRLSLRAPSLDRAFEPTGGSLYLRGNVVTISGSVEDGGGYRGGELRFDACRLHLTATAIIDGSFEDQQNRPGRNIFNIYGSMLAEAGSLIAGKPGSANRIRYRGAGGPPVLLGTATPEPNYEVEEGPVCSICGNSQTESDETCDDGNTAAGDGCDSFCQSE